MERSEAFQRTGAVQEHGEGLGVRRFTRWSRGGEGFGAGLRGLVPDPCCPEESGEIDAVGGHAMESAEEKPRRARSVS